MPISFFETRCKSSSNHTKFGICDDPLPARRPAYINEYNESTWIAIADNPAAKSVDFYAIDNCVDILRDDGERASRCDGVLRYNNTLAFVELKRRGGSGWLSDARGQLTATVDKFKAENDMDVYDRVEAYACNSLRPLAMLGKNTELQKFRNDTGLIMYAQQKVEIK